jgi:hypothetical protein
MYVFYAIVSATFVHVHQHDFAPAKHQRIEDKPYKSHCIKRWQMVRSVSFVHSCTACSEHCKILTNNSSIPQDQVFARVYGSISETLSTSRTRNREVECPGTPDSPPHLVASAPFACGKNAHVSEVDDVWDQYMYLTGSSLRTWWHQRLSHAMHMPVPVRCTVCSISISVVQASPCGSINDFGILCAC